MKIYSKIISFLTILLVVLYPVLVSFSKISGDLIIYAIILIQFGGLIIFRDERKDLWNTIKGLKNDKVFILLILLNIVIYTSATVAMDKRVAITNGIRFSMYTFVFYTISYKLKNIKAIDYLRYSFIGIAVVSSLVTVYQIVSGVFGGVEVDNAHRLSSFIENSNNLGAYTIFSIFIVIMLAITSKSRNGKILYGAATVLLLVNIIASQSRNALIALVVGSVIVAIAYDKRFLIGAAILPVILMIIPASRLRILQIFDPTQNESRFKIWECAKYMIKDYPFRGIGYENFGIQYELYVTKYRDKLLVWDGFRAQHPHNIFLKIQTELGIVGTIVFVGFLIASIIYLIRGIKRINDKTLKAVLIGILASFIAFNCMNMLDSYYSAPKVIICMFIVLGIANNYIKRETTIKGSL